MKCLCILLVKILEYKHIPKLWSKLKKKIKKIIITKKLPYLEMIGDFIFYVTHLFKTEESSIETEMYQVKF